MTRSFHFGVDVGTSSVRVALFESTGRLMALQVQDIKVHNLQTDFYEQSSEEIWRAICKCFNEILSSLPRGLIDQENPVASIGFDATCSLVVLDEHNQPLSVSPSQDDQVNVIMWMDHRAKKQAEFINSTAHECLRSVGGRISVEMDPPKLLWLKENLHDTCFAKAGLFFSLPDFLVWRSSGQDVRSICTTTCKWLYEYNGQEKKRWNEDFWQKIHLQELASNNFLKIGSRVEKPFSSIEGLQLSDKSLEELGLAAFGQTSVRVGVSMIDAHAGGVGALSIAQAFIKKQPDMKVSLEDILVLVSGTSSCFMASSKKAVCVDGIWGPYYEAMIPGFWLNEAGQSACGQLIHHLVTTHPAYNGLREQLGSQRAVFEDLEHRLVKLAQARGLDQSQLATLARDLHITPDFHGNRSPLADPDMKGMQCGLTFDTSVDNLAVVYLSALLALAYQAKHIIECLKANSLGFKLITIIGGLASNRLYCQLHSDITGLPVLASINKSDSIVLLGSAIVGASNALQFKDKSVDELLGSFARETGDLNTTLLRPDLTLDKFHQAKYQVYLKMIQDQRGYSSLMSRAGF